MSGCEHVYNEDSNDFKFTLKLWLGHVPEHYLIAECSFWKNIPEIITRYKQSYQSLNKYHSIAKTKRIIDSVFMTFQYF